MNLQVSCKMSTRWYPLYQRGNPQLRVFLPNFWMKLVRPTHKQPPNIVQFICSMEMTKHDIQNYLEKIYDIKTVDVRTRIGMGKTRRDMGLGYVVKDDDVKYAYAVLSKEEKFEFPDIFPSDKLDIEVNEKKALDESKKGFKDFLKRNNDSSGTPGWFSF